MIKTFSFFEGRNSFVDVWEPNKEMIVLGRFSKESDIKKAAYDDNLQIIRRVGGGGTVYLGKGVLIIDIGIKEEKHKSVPYYFNLFNSSIINALNSLKLNVFTNEDFFDLRIADKKIGGVSLAIRKDMVLYGASIIIRESVIDKITKYLNHPNKEPEYRKAREHSDFLTCLEVFSVNQIDALQKLNNYLSKKMRELT